MKKLTVTVSTAILMAIILSACAAGTNVNLPLSNSSPAQAQSQASPTAVPQVDQPTAVAQPPVAVSGSSLAAIQTTLEQIYQTVNPSVVSIQVEVPAQQTSTFPFTLPGQGNQQQAPLQQALGSGFVWDKSGNIVTNDHVVDGATSIKVQFSDGSIVDAKLVGADPDSDLAVVKVNVAADKLFPVTLADSSQVKVGQFAIAIGNPFGLESSMTVGIVSGLGRSLPANSSTNSSTGLSYSIPDVIQTDAPINPGNSGGVLLNDGGQVVGVTSAIESSTNSNAGIGFVIPSNIVKRVVPALIVDGKYQHAYLGITGTTLTSDLASQMGLPTDTRGALIIEVTSGSPADSAGLKGGNKSVDINGTQVQVGGDVITAINGQAITTMDDLVSYLATKADVGQKITLTYLRNGSQKTADVTLVARPSTPTPTTSSASGTGGGSLGITAATMNSQIASAMNLPADTNGVLVVSVLSGSAADQAGLQGGNKSVTVNGQQVEVGGDVIVAMDNHPIDSVQTLREFLSSVSAGETVTLTIIRGGQQMDLQVTLGALQ